MNILEKIMLLIEFRASDEHIPRVFGPFHIISLVLTILAAVLAVIFLQRCTDKRFRRIVLIAWAVMVVLEIYRELALAFNADGSTWQYDWDQFPFQLCATPLYILPIIAFMRDGAARNGAIAYIGLFSLFGGLVTVIYPETIFKTDSIGVCVQAILHHAIQVVIGALCLAIFRRRLTGKFYLGALIYFVGLMGIAMIINVIGHHALTANGITDDFNMFYISPFYDCVLPILGDVYKAVPYPVFLVIYAVGFALIAAIIFAIARLISSLAEGRVKKTM